MARQNFDSKVRTIIASLEIEMKQLNLMEPEYSLRYQVGSPTYGNSYWVSVTGGDLGTGIHIIDSLHLPSDCGRDNWLAVIKAYRNAINRVRVQRKESNALCANVTLSWSQL